MTFTTFLWFLFGFFVIGVPLGIYIAVKIIERLPTGDTLPESRDGDSQ